MLKIFHGAISSFINPLIFTIMTDYFPPEKRSFPNSIVASASYVGLAISSLTILLIKNFGWRAGYYLMGSLGLVTSALTFLLLKKSKNTNIAQKLEEAKKSTTESKDSFLKQMS